jgi:hypothetical protein
VPPSLLPLSPGGLLSAAPGHGLLGWVHLDLQLPTPPGLAVLTFGDPRIRLQAQDA